MLPILLIHGYSSEGKDTDIQDIYGTLPADLRAAFGNGSVIALNLSRWISLNDGISLDDVSFAMERALRSEQYAPLLQTGFHIVIHSTGALVARNWIRLFSARPSPVANLVHLAGANFGSGLAHVGQGQLARWGRLIFGGTGRGLKILDELEFGSWKTLDLHRHFLLSGNDMYRDYRVQEFCLVGSQTLPELRAVPIRYVKEDSADSTVRTSAGNLNYNYLRVTPKPDAYQMSVDTLAALVNQRLDNASLSESHYEFDLGGLATQRPEVPFAILYETSHFGAETGIVTGSKNRKSVVPLVRQALETPLDPAAYGEVASAFHEVSRQTFERVAKLKNTLLDWNKQSHYEGHIQIVFRLRDQFGNGIEHYDITFKSIGPTKKLNTLESMIEANHANSKSLGTRVFYLRTQSFDTETKSWIDLLDNVATAHFEITAHEENSDDIDFVPLTITLLPDEIRACIQTFRTTIVDVTMLRLPATRAFAIAAAR